ncbi:N-acetyl-gamma-glutamyl-phosphate reductase, partial [Dissostichus eleginoides]
AKAAIVPLIAPPSTLHPPRVPPCVADGRDHEALGERLSGVLTHFFDKGKCGGQECASVCSGFRVVGHLVWEPQNCQRNSSMQDCSQCAWLHSLCKGFFLSM